MGSPYRIDGRVVNPAEWKGFLDRLREITGTAPSLPPDATDLSADAIVAHLGGADHQLQFAELVALEKQHLGVVGQFRDEYHIDLLAHCSDDPRNYLRTPKIPKDLAIELLAPHIKNPAWVYSVLTDPKISCCQVGLALFDNLPDALINDGAIYYLFHEAFFKRFHLDGMVSSVSTKPHRHDMQYNAAAAIDQLPKFFDIPSSGERLKLWPHIAKMCAAIGLHFPFSIATYASFIQGLRAHGIDWPERFPSMRALAETLAARTAPADDHRPVALFIFAKADHNDAFKSSELFKQFLKRSDFRTLYYEANTNEEVRQIITTATHGLTQPAHTLVFAGHGSSTGIMLGSFLRQKKISSSDFGARGGFAEVIRKGVTSQIFNESCSTGRGRSENPHSFTNTVARAAATGVRVIGSPIDGAPDGITLDTDGRITVKEFYNGETGETAQPYVVVGGTVPAAAAVTSRMPIDAALQYRFTPADQSANAVGLALGAAWLPFTLMDNVSLGFRAALGFMTEDRHPYLSSISAVGSAELFYEARTFSLSVEFGGGYDGLIFAHPWVLNTEAALTFPLAEHSHTEVGITLQLRHAIGDDHLAIPAIGVKFLHSFF